MARSDLSRAPSVNGRGKRTKQVVPRSSANAPTGALRSSARAPAAALRARAEEETIEVFGAREHNLKIDHLVIPKRKLVVFTGVSGSGKSSMAFDTLYAEGQRRYI